MNYGMSEIDKMLVAGAIIAVALWSANKGYKLGVKIGEAIGIEKGKRFNEYYYHK